MTKPPPNFDWVTARATCGPQDMFIRLRELAQRDVHRRNEFAGAGSSKNRFAFHDSEERDVWAFRVSDRSHKGERGTDFRLDGDVIHVEPSDGEAVEITVAMNDDGDCKFRVGSREYDPWQVLRLALEPLFWSAPGASLD